MNKTDEELKNTREILSAQQHAERQLLEAREALRNAEEKLLRIQKDFQIEQVRLESIIQFSEDAIITKSLKGIVQTWNPAAEQIFGYSSEEIIGKPILTIIPKELHEEEIQILSKISRGERVQHLETIRIAKDGRRLFISLTSSPIKDSEGHIIGATKIARDITERKKHQTEVEMNEERYRALSEQKSSLLESELRARQQVEEANRIKDQFLATLSHELRTPLNAILGWSQLAARKINEPQRVQEGLEIIQRNARSQAQIIEDLLDINRIMSGTLNLEFQLVNFQRVIDEAIETVIPSAQLKEVNIEKFFDLGSSTVHGDPNRLKQIIWNLLTNAIKFIRNDSSTKKITVNLTSSAQQVNLEISDSGEGITPEFLPVIFNRFSQADTSSSRRYGGLGLGLSIVKHLVELHGGQISANSDGPGKGAVFRISLPLAISPQPEIKKSIDKESKAEMVFSQYLLGLSALVVDDEPDARNLLKCILEERGMKVWTVSSSEEALKTLSIRNFDIIVSDIGMPNEDGYQFIKKVRLLPNEKVNKIPAIALTAYARSEDRVLALEAGFQMHLAKPVEAVELLAVISSLKRSSHRS